MFFLISLLVCVAVADDCGWVDYRGYTVSDQATRDKLEELADHFCTRIWVTSGDRDWGTGSLHDEGRAADFWFDKYDGQQVWDDMYANRETLFSYDWEVIWHGNDTCTTGEHVHVGRYADGRDTCMMREGTDLDNVCEYICE